MNDKKEIEELKEEFKKRIVNTIITDIDISRSHDIYETDRDSLTEDDIDLVSDAVDIFIHLNNGVVLKIWNSEWGGITILKTDEQKRNDRKIYNPVTGKYYDARLRSSKYGKNGEIRGLWEIEKKNKKELKKWKINTLFKLWKN